MRMETRNKQLDKLFKRRTKIDIPDFQRDKVWTVKEKIMFIDTLLKGWRVPKLYFRVVDLDEQIYECIDGQQRLNAIYEFYEDKLKLPVSAIKTYGGITYSTLKPAMQDRFDDYDLQIDEIYDADEDELKDLFSRLQFGKPLNTPEKLNAVSGNMRDFAKDLISHDFFKNAINVKDFRYAHLAISCKFLYLATYKLPTRLRLEELKEMLTNNFNFSNDSPVAKKVIKTLDFLYKIFNEQPKLLSNRANIISAFNFLYHFDNLSALDSNLKEIKNFFIDFFDDLEKEAEKGSGATNRELLKYQDAISRNTDSAEAISSRQSILSNRLLKCFPKFHSMISTSRNQKEHLIEEKAAMVTKLISKVNRNNQEFSGEDKIKITPETLEIERSLKTLADTPESFGKLIDFLYELLYEGSAEGKRLKQSKSEVIQDIKIQNRPET